MFKKEKSLMSLLLFHCLHCCLSLPGRHYQIVTEGTHPCTLVSEHLSSLGPGSATKWPWTWAGDLSLPQHLICKLDKIPSQLLAMRVKGE